MGSSSSKKPAAPSGSVSDESARYLNPTGLYPTCNWDLKTIRKLIIEKKLAPFFPGREEKDSPELDECPICFMFYGGGLNRTKCCRKGVCTECFLQIKKPGTPLAESICPFCNRERFTVVFLGPKSREERMKEEMEEQRVLEIQERMRQEEIERDLQRERERQKNKDKEQGVEKETNRRETNPDVSVEGLASRRQASRHASRSGSRSGATAQTAMPPLLTPPTGSSPEQDLEEMMLMEAIRLSLIETNQKVANDGRRDERSSSPSPEDSDEDRSDEYLWAGPAAEIDLGVAVGKRRESSAGTSAGGLLNNRSRRGSSVSSAKEKERGEESDKEEEDCRRHHRQQHQADRMHKQWPGGLFGQDAAADDDTTTLLIRKRGVLTDRSSSSSS